mmetsp:Transcript_12256/g.18176  ORF Transcript_12256/g.18176 Transcript_12256/m.18176 type:complete len:331 (+) Transcript_12256:92-1084(+)
MGHLSFFTAAYVGGGAIASTFGGEDTSAMSSLVARPQQERQQQRRRRPVINSASSKAVSSIFVAALLLCMLAFAAAQDEPKCNCSPVGYTFELKLDAYTCPDPNDSIRPDDAVAYFGPGVKAYTCNPKSQIPVTINEAQFIVSDETNNPVDTQTKDSLELTDGETLTFTSPKTNPPLVGFILLKLVGKDINGVKIESRFTIQFTNECGVLSLEDGTEFSLVIFRDLERPSKTLCPREDPVRAFSKAGKGSKHTRHSSSKSGKNLNSKYDGYGGKSSKSKSGKSKDSRRILQTATSANAEHTSLPPMILKDQSVEKGGHEGLPLRRRRLHG